MIWLMGAITASVLAAAVIAIGAYVVYLKKKKSQDFAVLKAGYQVNFAMLALKYHWWRVTFGRRMADKFLNALKCSVKDSRHRGSYIAYSLADGICTGLSPHRSCIKIFKR